MHIGALVPSPSKATLTFGAILVAVLGLTWFVYHPGLDGAFLFDDYSNLPALGITGPINSWPSLLRYLTCGTGDPLGRPMALLSFLIDAQNWPADAYAFKRTNVLLHLLNGALLCWLMLVLGTRAGLFEKHACRAALLASTIWLLHPLFVSTTLYVVQREAMLPATFTFAGMLLWCKGQQRLDSGQTLRGGILATSGSLLCTLFAALSKANGLLLPLFIAVAELTVMRAERSGKGDEQSWFRRHRMLYVVTLIVPLVLLVIVLALQIPQSIRAAAEGRPWTIGQRLLTEPRVLIHYLALLWIPRSNSFGLFNDQIRASANWLAPWTTLPCILVIVGLVTMGWQLRRRNPVVAYSILFYFAGHAIESTFLPLELAFEHRNYLPAAFMFWPACVWLSSDSASMPRIRKTVSVLILALLAGLTWSSSRVWGDLRMQGLIWAKINPDSSRAQALAGNIEAYYGHADEAIARLKAAAERMPDEPQITLNLVGAECAKGAVTQETWETTLHSLRHTNGSPLFMNTWFDQAIQQAQSGKCQGLDLSALEQAVTAMRANPNLTKQPGQYGKFERIAGLIELAEGHAQEALDHFDRALADASDRGLPLAQAAALGMAGYPELGLRHLEFAGQQPCAAAKAWGMPRVYDWVLEKQHYWEHETEILKATLMADAGARQSRSRHAGEQPHATD